MKKGDIEKKKDSEMVVNYNDLIIFNFIYNNWLNQFQHRQSELRKGNVIPDVLKMNIYKESGFFFGKKNDGDFFIGKPSSMDGHILVVGTPGNGKTTGIVIPTMITWRGIQIIVDVKGNLYSHWKRLNKHTGRKIKIFRPCAPKGNSCRYDPYAPLRSGDVAGNARILALALMPLMPSIKDPIWIQAAQNFLTGTIIYYFNNGYSFLDTMTKFQFTLISKMIDEIMEQDNMAAKLYIIKLKEVQVNVIGNIGMELSKLAALITDPAIINIFHTDAKRGLIDWADLNTRKKPFDIILEFPETDMERLEPLMKLMLNQLIKSLEQRPERTYGKGSELPPVLLLLDEFPRLGNISAIENGLKTLRSRGVTFALFVQSLADLEKIYGPETARVIADICSFKLVLGVTDVISQEYFSKAVGTIESIQRNAGINFNPLSGMFFGYGMNISETREPIIYPHEFLTLKDVVVINPHNGFCRVDKIMFHEHEDMFLRPQQLQNQKNVEQTPTLALTTHEGGGKDDRYK